MSSFVYPASLPGLTFDNTRSPNYNTGLQPALSGKESSIAYQLYPMMEFELQYEFLTGASQTNSDIRALLGLFMAMKGQADTFLFVDPEFNTVALMPFATTDGASTAFQTTATYQNSGGPGGPEIIQNFNGAPSYFLNRFFTLNEQLASVSRALPLLWNGDPTNAAWTKTNLTAAFLGGAIPTVGGTTVNIASLTETSTPGVSHVLNQAAACSAATGIDVTFSAIIFPSLRSWVAIQMQESVGSQTAICYFNLTGPLGTIGTVTLGGANWSNARVSMTPLGADNAFKCTLTVTKNSAATTIQCFVIPATANNVQVYTGSSGSTSIFAWGMQFEQASFASATVPSTGSIITQADYSVGPTGIITLAGPLTVGLPLLWSGSFFYRCRFTEDKMTVSQFVNKFWENKSVTIRQRKL